MSANNVDAVALTAGVVAVAITVYVADGLYSLMSLIFSVAIVLSIVAYVGKYQRTRLQTAALIASLGIATLPAIGFIAEGIMQGEYGYGFIKLIAEEPACELGNPTSKWGLSFECAEGKPQSKVVDWMLTLGYLIACCLFYLCFYRGGKSSGGTIRTT
jgi:hypothetical protein